MPSPKKNLIDSFMTGLMKDAKIAVDSVSMDAAEIIPKKPKVNKKDPQPIKDQDHISIVSRSYHDHNNNISSSEQDQSNNRTGLDQDHDNISKGSDKDQISSRSLSGKDQVKVSPKDQGRSTIPKKPKKITKGSPSGSLSKSQTLVYFWFNKRGESGVFNKPEIERDLSMPYITIRKAINKLVSVGLIELSYDTCQKIYEYELFQNKNVKLAKNISIGAVSYQDQNNIGAQPLISSSSLLNKTTTNPTNQSDTESTISEIMNSDPEYKYWIDQQVTPTQVSRWKNEFGLDLQTILKNLCYVRWQITKQGTKINKSAADLLYSIMKKNGGTVNKPANYKSMAQMDLEFFENWKNQRVEHSQKIEALQQEAIQKEIEPKVTALLSKPDLENEHMKEALEKIYSPARKNAIINRIKNGDQLDSKEKASLKRCLEDVFMARMKQS